MSLPSLLEYQQAVLHPQYAFPRDPELQSGQPALTPMKIAAVASGGFAATFRIDNTAGGQSYAVRCFHKLGTDDALAQRYEQIARFVARNPQLDFMVNVHYDPQGIVVAGNPFPTVRMPWITGDPLGDWVDDHFDEPDKLNDVRRALANALTELHALGVAHGDLQHGNIMVGADQSITLIDYDGMYLPELAPFGAAERGHPNYQHPDRGDTTYDEEIDAFSAYVIDLSLDAISRDPDLYDRFGGGGQNLLFSAPDFADPDKSEVFAALLAGPLATRTQRLKSASTTEYKHVVRALRGEPTPPRAAKVHVRAGLDVLLANNAAALRRRQGDQVTVVGTVVRAYVTQDWRGNPIAFLNFGDYKNGDFTIVVFGAVVTELQRRHGGKTLPKLRNARVALIELVTLYENDYSTTNLTPQMVLSRANQLQVLDDATYRALVAKASASPRSQAPKQPSTPKAQTATDPSSPPPKRTVPTGAGSTTSDLLSTMMARHPAPAPPPTAPPPKPEPTYTPKPPRPPSPVPAADVPRTVHIQQPRPATWSSGTPQYGYSAQPHAVYVQRSRQLRPRSRVRTGSKVVLAFLAVVLGLAVLSSMAKDRQEPQPASAPQPVRFQSKSTNLSCVVTFEAPATVRCDADKILYQPPPAPPDCNQPRFGHSIMLSAGGGAHFPCVSDSLIDHTLPVLEYGTSRSYGPFTCDSDRYRGITCRDRTTGWGFRIERDSFELY
ncbi:hypothetical protein [Nocardia gamkensis]|uniref:Protein kinase domain-containing protein n=1 Tax=Nocardia gamkensis TaxID=352869 RepID=A0A7X6R3S6_9NOCA|nr:hypothetical protein [Nocardia gamkensis]NKY27774.1 hypothetical protein [Nocardia gamkensis]NQE67415.1 hypothetical protein [Nocardia gamkensis]